MKNKTLFFILLGISIIMLSHCMSKEKKQFMANIDEGKKLANIYCKTCHVEVSPDMLDKNTWALKVLPQMGPRLGIFKYKALHYPDINPILISQQPVMTQEQWDHLVEYYVFYSPDSLPKIEYEVEPQSEGSIFQTSAFSKDIDRNAILTMIEVDTVNEFVYLGDAVSNSLFQLDYKGNLLDSLKLPNAATGLKIDSGYMDITQVGILHPNNEDEGQIIRMFGSNGLQFSSKEVLVDSIYRPVFTETYDYNYDGKEDFLVCEYGNDIGRLSIYFQSNDGRYNLYIIENIPGAIMTRTYDFNNDGYRDIAALFAQGDERIVIYYNDGQGEFRSGFTIVERFPAVYGSMFFNLHDFNDDGYMDILYINGDNFDYSQILKPYHGVRILENDGDNNFEQKYYYPIYGSGRAYIEDFDLDGDNDLMVVSNFGDMENNPERGIMYLENQGLYQYKAFSFLDADQNQWNTMGVADFDNDGDKDVIVGSMNLANVEIMDEVTSGGGSTKEKTSVLLLKNMVNERRK